MSAQMKSDSAVDSEFLAFRIGDQEYCVDIMQVREIRGWTPTTTLPHAPSFVRGVINLRGSVLPIVDLADRLGLPSARATKRHVVIVVQAFHQTIGLLVDAVSDILTEPRESIQPTPDVASEVVRDFVQGVLAIDNRLINVIALDNLAPAALQESA
ncbi:MAG: chemotaxis protein CheW [Beijerinckiaceae bacterium]